MNVFYVIVWLFLSILHLFIYPSPIPCSGTITIADGNFKVTEKKEKAFRGAVKAVAYLMIQQRQQYIIAIGDDSKPGEGGGPYFAVKVFSVSELTQGRLIQTFQANPNLPPSAIPTSFVVLSDGSQMAIGFSNGTVLLFTGSFLKETTR
jgi:hypothetical protein